MSEPPVSEVKIRRPATHERANQQRYYQRKREEKAALAAITFVNPRTCKLCGQTKEQEKFSSFIIRGARRWHTRCTQCRNEEYQRTDTCRAKRKFLDDLRAKPCDSCGRNDLPPRVMRFVCVRGAPSFGLSVAWTGRSMKSIVDESVKYSVRCPTCVEIKRLRDREEIRPHKSKLAELPPELRAQVGDMSNSAPSS